MTIKTTLCANSLFDCYFKSSDENGNNSRGSGVTEIKLRHKNKLGNACSIIVLACLI
jgi:hypothetical protein